MSEYLLSTSGLTKQFGHHKAVNNVDLHVKKGANLRIYRKKRRRKDNIFKNDQRIIKADRR